jgi:hypothetical protein
MIVFSVVFLAIPHSLCLFNFTLTRGLHLRVGKIDGILSLENGMEFGR